MKNFFACVALIGLVVTVGLMGEKAKAGEECKPLFVVIHPLDPNFGDVFLGPFDSFQTETDENGQLFLKASYQTSRLTRVARYEVNKDTNEGCWKEMAVEPQSEFCPSTLSITPVK